MKIRTDLLTREAVKHNGALETLIRVTREHGNVLPGLLIVKWNPLLGSYDVIDGRRRAEVARILQIEYVDCLVTYLDVVSYLKGMNDSERGCELGRINLEFGDDFK